MSRRVAGLLLIALLAVSAAQAWNPASLDSNDQPLRWGTGVPVIWNPDGGGLGKLTNAQATTWIADELAKWQAVGTASLNYTQGVQIIDPGTGMSTDVTSANYSDVINTDNGQNPIIYDNDRDIFDLLGTPDAVVGFAGTLRTAGTEITKGYAVLQGDWFDDEPAAANDVGEISETRFRGMIVHEFGHFSGLGHSSVNHELTVPLPGCALPTTEQIETMSPFLTDGSLTLHHDDEIGLSSLYPTGSFQTGFATIEGTLLNRDGVSGFQGGNLILRPDTADCAALYDEAQGMQSGAAPGGGDGSYRFNGLNAGGAYTVLATRITDGAQYTIPPADLGGPDDYYNGADEDSFDPPDDPAAFSPVVAPSAGQTLGSIDIGINNDGNPGALLTDQTEGLNLAKFDGSTPLPPVEIRFDDDSVNSAKAFSGTAQASWVTRITPAADELPFRLERIDVLFIQNNSLAPGRAIRLLVYADPAATGNPDNASLVYSEDTTIQQLSNTDFNEYTLASPVTISAGEYYIGVLDLVADATNNFIIAFDNDSSSGRSYDQAQNSSADPDPSFFTLEAENWMLRARGSTIPPAGSVELTWGAPCNDATVADQDFGVYEGSLASLGGSQDHAPLTCSTGMDRSYVVIGSADDRYWLVSPVLATKEGSLGSGSSGQPRTPVSTCATVDPATCP